MAPKLYKLEASPPVRAVYLAARALGVEMELIDCNLMEGDHLKAEFLELNPQHTIPTLVDDGKAIWDSHAINAYLVTKYGKDDSLYPKDPYKRAVVDQRLHFDSGLAFVAVRRITEPIIFWGAKSIPPELREVAEKVYEFLEKFLQGNKWTAGDNITLADFSLIPSITSLAVHVPIDADTYPNITGWIKRAEELPYYDANQKGLDDFKALVKQRLSS